MRLRNIPAVLLLASILGIVALKAQSPPTELHLTIIEGNGAINNLQRRTAREPIVQVTDQNHRPVAGAAVSFELPGTGAGGAFKGANVLKVVTNAKGIAKAAGFRPNTIPGSFEIHVTASFHGHVVGAAVAQTNGLAGAVPASAGAGAGGTGGASGAGGAAGGTGAATSTAGTAGAAGAGAAGTGTAGAAAATAGAAAAGAATGLSTVAIVAIGGGVAAGGAAAAVVAVSSGSSSNSPTSTPTGTIGSPGPPVIGPAIVPQSRARLIAGSIFERPFPTVAFPVVRVLGPSRGVTAILFRLVRNRFARLTLQHFSFGPSTDIGDGRTVAMHHGVRK